VLRKDKLLIPSVPSWSESIDFPATASSTFLMTLDTCDAFATCMYTTVTFPRLGLACSPELQNSGTPLLAENPVNTLTRPGPVHVFGCSSVSLKLAPTLIPVAAQHAARGGKATFEESD
jgi:hypothetical protein